MDLDQYSANVYNLVAGGFVTTALSIGKEVGLIDTLIKLTTPVTCQHLADLCNLKERYVREWLGCMVASRVVSLNDEDKYFIPEHCKPGLGVAGILGIYSTVSAMSKKATECFRKDGPSGYGFDDMPREIVDAVDNRMGDESAAREVELLLEPINKIKELSSLLNVLDLGSGAGVLTRALSKRFPDAEVFGVDFNELAIKKADAHTDNPSNVKYLKASVASLPADWTNKFDWVVIYDVLHDLPCPEECMREVARVLKDDGLVSITDPHVHSNHRDNVDDLAGAGIRYAISSVVCLPSSMSADGAAGHGIGWGTENRETFLTKAGWCIEDKRIQGTNSNFTCSKCK
ncbi:S-adenosylmethionine-dependent methyltransferase Rv2258c-like [Argopecten irradians]|uniref:S-adenosylmethionine-dependent methyltransferase Rv2258c-like n=1 Tax=Argopecten irradians TaxID=31199 RepID=UPI003718D942